MPDQKRPAEIDPIATTLPRSVEKDVRKRGGVLAALRRSPLVGAELDLTRPVLDGREIDL
jgi:hypothetical protein